MHLDDVGAILAGRELSAYPMTTGSPRLFIEDGALIGTLDYGSQRVATATMAYKHQALDPDEARAQITVPLRDQGHARLHRWFACLRSGAHADHRRHHQGGLARARRLQLLAHEMAPLADLPVREIVSASHVLTDLTLAPATPVHDYLR